MTAMSNVNRVSRITLDWPEYGLHSEACELVGEVRIGKRDYTVYKIIRNGEGKRSVVVMQERVDGTARSMVEIVAGKARRFTLSGAFRYLAALA